MRMPVLAVGVGVAAMALAARAADAPPLAFEGVELGTSEAAWKALKPPGPVPEHARRLCSDEAAGAAAGLTAKGLAKGAVVCGEVDAYGRIVLPVTFTWERQYPLERLRFVFQRDRLAEIRAQLPADAFDAVMAELRKSYGAPSRTRNDRVETEIGRQARVTETWTLPQGRIELVDPTAPGKLSLRLSAAAA